MLSWLVSLSKSIPCLCWTPSSLPFYFPSLFPSLLSPLLSFYFHWMAARRDNILMARLTGNLPPQLTSIRENWGTETIPYCQVEFQTLSQARALCVNVQLKLDETPGSAPVRKFLRRASGDGESLQLLYWIFVRWVSAPIFGLYRPGIFMKKKFKDLFDKQNKIKITDFFFFFRLQILINIHSNYVSICRIVLKLY